ncbi:family 16 glycosylhydrolase [Massilia glaciei]|nr:family 16 glycosylhydrolase [Massilia glaciei]
MFYTKNYAKRIKRPLLAAALALLASPSFGQQCPSLTPVFADEFNGTAVDLNKWEMQIGDGCSYGLCGWGNGELQSYQAANATVANGLLTITAKKQRVGSKSYTSARMRTLNRPGGGQWKHGRFEARIKTPKGSGMWSAFWMLPANTTVGWPASGEIDIQEATGQKSMFHLGSIHYGSSNTNHQFLTSHIYKQPDSWADAFHVYSVVWSPNKISWYIDDVLYATKTPSDMANPADWTFENYQYYLILNMAVGGTLGGTVDATALPQTLQADYVRVYAYPQPSLSGPLIVEPNTSSTYRVVDQAGTGATYAWSGPGGQSSSANTFTVNWGTTGGTVSLSTTDGCGSFTKSAAVTVSPVLAKTVTLDDFEAIHNISYTATTGVLNQSVPNPAPNTVNNSATVAKYVRNAATAYDLVNGSTTQVPDASFYLRGDKAFYLDVYTGAAVGTPLLIQLENKNVATASNFPVGRHSRYLARTTVQNGWQRLKFLLDDRLDTNTANSAVNQMVLLINPNTLSGDTYYLDNYAIHGH